MRSLRGWPRHLTEVWLGLSAALHFYWAGFGFPEPMEMAAIHLMLFLPPLFVLFPFRRVPMVDDTGDLVAEVADQPTVIDWMLAAAVFVPSFYVYTHASTIYERSSYITPLGMTEIVLGSMLVLLVIEAVRRSLSIALAILALLALAYLFFCDLLPSVWYYRDIPFAQIVETQYFMVDSGLYGSLTRIAASLIATFLVFGAFMQATGMGRLFNNIGIWTAGGYSAGPAKVCVISSGLFGTMSGSSVANVVVSGQFTIPMMKRIGFSPTVATAIEASSSVGGPLVPPVMGAAAFVIAETTGIPYSEIIIGAALIAVLYFAGNLLNVHLEGRKLGIGPMPKEEIPGLRELLKDAHLLIPITVLTVLMMMQYSAYRAAFISTIVAVVIACLFRHTRMTPRGVWLALVDAGRTICLVSAAVAAAGIITVTLTSTGLVIALSGIISGIAGDSLTLLVVLLAISCLVMGMGVPTTPAYIITAAIGAPLLIQQGVPVLNAHLFAFYFAVLADVTPPVAGATYAAAAIGKAPPIAAGFRAMRFSVGGFLCGLAVAFEPALTLDGSLFAIASITAAIMLGITFISGGIIGFLVAPLPIWLRAILIAIGLGIGLAHTVPSWERAIFGAVAYGILYLALRRSAPALRPLQDSQLNNSLHGE